MLNILGMNENIKNIILFSSHKIGKIESGLSVDKIRSAYRETLSQLQPAVPRCPGSTPVMITEAKDIISLVDIFNCDNALNDISHAIKPDRQAYEESMKLFRQFQESIASNLDLDALFSLAVTGLFYAPSDHAGGGTTSAAIGVIWVDPRPSWNRSDLFEMMVHELSHTLMFIDEYTHRHYESLIEIAKEKYYFRSAILAKDRPLDKVVHSLVVSTEVLISRMKNNMDPAKPHVHPPSKVMLEKALATAKLLIASETVRDLCTDRAMDLIEICLERLCWVEKERRLSTPRRRTG